MLVFILLIMAILSLAVTFEPEKLKEVKRRYKILRENLPLDDSRWDPLRTECLLVGLWRNMGTVGWNTNKGYEIGLCLNGTVNQIMHVLIHELAHCTVDEYSHSSEYWKNFIDLRTIAENINVYNLIKGQEKFCSQKISDGI